MEYTKTSVGRMVPVQYPGNDREFIIDHLFWKADDSHWEKLPGTGCHDVQEVVGYSRSYAWRADAPGAGFVWRGHIEADLVGIARLRVRAQAAVSVRVRLRAEIDGQWVTLVDGQPGNNDYDEYDGPVNGRRLTCVEIGFISAEAGPNVSSVMWVMIVKAGKPLPIPMPDSAWPGMLRAVADEAETVPTLGLVFDAAGLDALRRQVRMPECAPAWAECVARAEAFARIEPETTANPVIPYDRKQYGRPDVPEQPHFAEVDNLAFVGLVEKRSAMMRVAARWALTWSRCERWVQCGVENLRGIEHSHGRFIQASATIIVAHVLDWCGGVLTDAGRHELARAIHDLGILDIDGIMQPDSYVWHMNQGIVYENGRFFGVMAVRQWYPDEFPRRLDDAQRMLQACLGTAFYADGAGTEGCGYWNYTMASAVPLIVAISRSTGRSIREVTPPNAAASGRWAWLSLRTDCGEAPRFLTHADGGFERAIIPLVASFFAGPLRQVEWEAAARASYLQPEGAAANSSFCNPLYLSLMRDILSHAPRPAPAAPMLTVFQDAGEVDVQPRAPGAGMRIHFLSGSRTGHCHDDKNSFMLEASGRMLLLDRATPGRYTHPATSICKMTAAHNAVAPDGLTQSVEPGQGGAVLLRAVESGDGRVIIESDAAGCWPGLSRRALRRLTHIRPCTLIVDDEVEWTRPVRTWQCWQAPAEWRHQGEGWAIAVDGVELLLTILSDHAADVEAEPFSVDGLLRPVHRLVVRSAREPRSRLCTLVRVRRVGEPWPAMTCG